MDESFCLSATNRSALPPSSPSPCLLVSGLDLIAESIYLLSFPSCRRRTANTSFTQNSNHMSPSSIISSRSRSRRRLTRSSGANGRTPLTFCCPLTVRRRSACFVTYLPRFGRDRPKCSSWIVYPRQDHQTMEGFRKITPCCFGVQPLGWPKKPTDAVIPLTSSIAKDDAARQHHRRRSPQGLRQRSCISHSFNLCQF